MKPLIWIATANDGKAQEFKQLLPQYEVKTLLDLPNYQDIKETGTTFSQNSLLKAQDLAKYIDGIAIGDDSGICLDALNGFPGIHSKRWAAPVTDFKEICQMLVDKLDSTNFEHRKAQMVTTIAYFDHKTKTKMIFEGIVEGVISDQVYYKETGFGYDHIFQPNDSEKTYSQMGSTFKNIASARKLAIEKLVNYLNQGEKDEQKKN